jgi:hypothetical protein
MSIPRHKEIHGISEPVQKYGNWHYCISYFFVCNNSHIDLFFLINTGFLNNNL